MVIFMVIKACFKELHKLSKFIQYLHKCYEFKYMAKDGTSKIWKYKSQIARQKIQKTCSSQ